MNEAKKKSTPMVTIKRIRNSTSSLKFKRLSKILDTYSSQLLTIGKTPFLTRKIN